MLRLSFHATPSLRDFAAICAQTTPAAAYPLAEAIRSKVVCYAGDTFRTAIGDAALRLRLLRELHHAYQDGPGVVVVREAYQDKRAIEAQNVVFNRILEQESDRQTGDHFAKAGANGRIWNVLQKSALADPAAFIDYYKNPVLQLLSEAWLGPDYQMTAQVNVVRPSGQAQAPHRDYHLGFQSQEVLASYPPHVHVMSTQLTLQGAVAHTDMPLESGPTLLLPFSQQYPLGYLAWREPEFKAYFDEHAIQLALKQGDALFFSPALFHAAGSNTTTDFHRIANLMQVSSTFGRPMESVDRHRMTAAVYPALLQKRGELSPAELDALLSSCCECYSFPTNLDTDPPLGGMAPETQKQLTRRALAEGWPEATFLAALQAHQVRRQA